MMSRLRQIAKIASLALIICLGHAGARADSLSADITTGWVGDIPVPADALIETDSAVNFDSPSGRVIRFTFQVALNEDDVNAYYKETLAGLGWHVAGPLYQRGSEAMLIEAGDGASSGGGRMAYRVTLAPADSAAFQ